ncbi:MAG: mercury resistance system transport protein MerF [Halofilum sp. (in: g-proteobacteria)]|nr:mercury resistance system transport protein MerF [Halofilum sp. (in: g-proteobacteria)]
MNRDQKLLCTGAGGSVIAAICCFTPVLVIGFAAIGLSWAVGYLDYVLLPALAVFLALTVFAAWRIARHRTTDEERTC